MDFGLVNFNPNTGSRCFLYVYLIFLQKLYPTVDESANAVTQVANDTATLVNAMSQIQTETDNNQDISVELGNEVKRFKQV